MVSDSPLVRLLYQSSALRVWDYTCPGCDTHEHVPEVARNFEMSFTRHGMYQIKVGRQQYVTNANHVTYFNQGEEYRVDHPVSGRDASTVISLQPETLRQLLGEFRPRLFEIDSSRLRFHSAQTMACAPLPAQHAEFLHILRTRPSDHLAIESSAFGLCESALSTKEDRLPFRPSTQGDYRERIEHLKTFMYNHLATELRLVDLAREAAFSPFHLTRVFRQVTGVTLHRYVMALRLNHAMHALTEGCANLTGLAIDLGFASHSHFTDCFHAYFGRTPSTIRALHSAIPTET